jgi:hypothetical protein
MVTPLPAAAPLFEIRFKSLFVPGRGMAFPCDARGQVDFNALSEHARNNYRFARIMIGRDFAQPCVCRPEMAEA